jgi:hypothetical protein
VSVVDGDECHHALRENVSAMYEVFRDAVGNKRLYASLYAALSPFPQSARDVIHVAENFGEALENFDIERKQRGVTKRRACRI